MPYRQLSVPLFSIALAAFVLLAPSGPARAERFIVAGDPQIGFSGDIASDKERFIALAHLAEHHQADFVLIAGDMVNYGSTQEWSAFDDALGYFTVPVYAARGNHDAPAKFEARFGPSNYTLSFTNLSVVVIDAGNVRNATGNPNVYQQQWDWLESAVSQAAKSTEHVMMLMHEPPYLWKENLTASLSGNYWAPPERERLLSLVRQYGVEAILAGHVHANNAIVPADGAFTIYTTAGTSKTMPAGEERLAYRLFDVDDSGVHQQIFYDFTDPNHLVPEPASTALLACAVAVGCLRGRGTRRI